MEAKASFPILGILGVLFIGLKLADIIAWSWWWVLAPFWGPWALLIAFAGLCVFVGGFAKVLKW